jgi:DNA modification methylase
LIHKPHKNEKSKYVENTHPSVKPLKLMSCLITMGSREGDIVLDLFCGSGKALEAANMLKRRFIGCEMDEKWKPVIEARAFRRTRAVKALE